MAPSSPLIQMLIKTHRYLVCMKEPLLINALSPRTYKSRYKIEKIKDNDSTLNKTEYRSKRNPTIFTLLILGHDLLFGLEALLKLSQVSVKHLRFPFGEKYFARSMYSWAGAAAI